MPTLVQLAAAACLASGCATVSEDHYLYAEDANGQPVNFFHLEVHGWTTFSAARYIAGFYDARAVDMFFNQLTRPDASNVTIRPLFSEGQKEIGGEAIKPLSPTLDNGTFVMVLSSSAKAVTDAIGQFADNQVASDALARLVSGPRMKELKDRTNDIDQTLDERSATAAEVAALFALLSDTATADEASRKMLDILRAIARAEGGSADFTSLEDAQAWFNARRTAGAQR
jgi:hypothetical protein